MADTDQRDFAQVAMEITQTEQTEETPQTKAALAPTPKVEIKQEKPERRLPDEIFGGKKQEEKKPEPAADEKFEIDNIPDAEFKDPKRKADWDGLKSKGREFEKQARENAKKADALETKIKEFEAKGNDTTLLQSKLTELEKQNVEYLALVQKVNIELDPAFREQFVEGRKRLIKNARTIVEESGLNPSDIETALSLKGKSRVDAMKEIAEGMTTFEQARLGQVINELTNLDDAAELKRGNPEEYLAGRAKAQQEQAAHDQDARARSFNLGFDKAETKLSGELEVLRKVDGLDWWNDQGKGITDRARQNFNSSLEPETAASIFIKAETAAVYRDLFLSQREDSGKKDARIAEMEKELNGIYGKTPKLDGHGSGKGAGGFKSFAEVAGDVLSGKE